MYGFRLDRFRSTVLMGYLCIGLTHMIHPPDAVARESVRTQEILQCKSGEIVTWSDGRDRPASSTALVFTYNHSGAPAWFTESLVKGLIAKSSAAWSQCGIQSELLDMAIAGKRGNDVIHVQWNDSDSRGNFGLANLGSRTLSLGAKAFGLLKTRNPAYDSRETLQMVISHEMGHFFGLMAHSRRCVDVLSYYDNGKGEKCYSRDPAGIRSVVEYRSVLPTACDIERCRKTNGKPALPEGRLSDHTAF